MHATEPRFNGQHQQFKKKNHNSVCAAGRPCCIKLLVYLLVMHVLSLSVHALTTTSVQPCRRRTYYPIKAITNTRGRQRHWINSRGGTTICELTALPSSSRTNNCSFLNSSPLFSSNDVDNTRNNPSKTPRSARQNLAVLARLSVSGMLAFCYMNYFALATFGAWTYYLFQKLVAKKGVKDGEWIMLGFIVVGLAVLKKIMGPAKLALELVVTSFFSYLFLSLAQSDNNM